MTADVSAIAGTCATCGRDLVQAEGRTYHPAEVMPPDAPCPDLLPIPGTELLSFDVPTDRFRTPLGATR